MKHSRFGFASEEQKTGALFCRIGRTGQIQVDSALSQTSLDKNTLIKRIKEAGVAKLTWHDFRAFGGGKPARWWG